MEINQSQDIPFGTTKVNQEAFPVHKPGIAVQSMQSLCQFGSPNQVQASRVQPSSTVSGPAPQESLLHSVVPVSEHHTASASCTEEFDFEAMNERFEKDLEITE